MRIIGARTCSSTADVHISEAVNEVDAGGGGSGGVDDVFYLFLQKQKIRAELHIYLEEGTYRKRLFRGEDTDNLPVVLNFAPFQQKSLGNCTRPIHPSNPEVRTSASPKAVSYPEGLVDTQHTAVSDARPVVSAQSQFRMPLSSSWASSRRAVWF